MAKVSIAALRVDDNPYMVDAGPMGHYKVTLYYKGRQLTTYFSQGYAHTKSPDAYDVLECLLSDASHLENSSDMDEMYADLGIDLYECSAKQRRDYKASYKAMERNTKKLKRLLGEDYDSFYERSVL